MIITHQSSSIKYHYRPFKRSRYSPFTGWGKIFHNCWENINAAYNKTYPIAQSILGRVVIYCIADYAGATIGHSLGSTILGNIGSWIGKNLVSTKVLGFVIGSEIVAFKCHQPSKKRDLFLTALTTTTTALLIMKFFDELDNYGASWGRLFGEEMGGFAGTILGGFCFLKIAGSPSVFLNDQNPWDSYSTSTTRFLVVGMVFESVIAKPSTPWIGPCLRILRTVTCITLQNVAYNANTIILLTKKKLNNNFAQPKIPAIAKMAINTYCGHNSQFFEEEFARCSLKQIFPSLAKHQFELVKKFDGFLPSLLLDGIKNLADHSEKMTSISISAFHEYAKLLTESAELIEVHQEFRKAIMNQTGKHLKYKEQIVQIILAKISTPKAPIRDQFIQFFINNCWTFDYAQQSMKTVTELIQKLEVALIGIPLSTPQQIAYLNEILDIYLQYYLIFLLFKYNTLESLTPVQEHQSIVILTHAIFNHYVESIVPKPIAKASHIIITKALQTAFKAENLLTLFFHQPEQISYVYSSAGIKTIENYALPPVLDMDLDSFEIVEKLEER